VTRAEPLTFPLAGLLGESPGARREIPIERLVMPISDDLRLASPLEGSLRLARTNRGVLVEARIATSIGGSCSRCLRELEIPLRLQIDEEALPSLDLGSGQQLDRSAEPDALRLTDHHELELGPLVREAVLLAEPIAPLCEPDCPGLCITCGARLDEGHPSHPDDDIDPRLAALRGFVVDGEPENG